MSGRVLAIWLRGWNFAAGSGAIAGCFVSSYLLAKCNSVAAVTVIYRTVMWGQMRKLTPLWTVTLK